MQHLHINFQKKKILVFEINKNLIPTLKKNLTFNNCNYKIFINNLTINKKHKRKTFYLSEDYLDTTCKKITKKKIDVKNLDYNKIDKKKCFNTLIIDAEGDEEHYIKSLKNLKNIKFIIFELHYNLFNTLQIKDLMLTLKKSNFTLKDKCFNSFYFSRDL